MAGQEAGTEGLAGWPSGRPDLSLGGFSSSPAINSLISFGFVFIKFCQYPTNFLVIFSQLPDFFVKFSTNFVQKIAN